MANTNISNAKLFSNIRWERGEKESGCDMRRESKRQRRVSQDANESNICCCCFWFWYDVERVVQFLVAAAESSATATREKERDDAVHTENPVASSFVHRLHDMCVQWLAGNNNGKMKNRISFMCKYTHVRALTHSKLMYEHELRRTPRWREKGITRNLPHALESLSVFSSIRYYLFVVVVFLLVLHAVTAALQVKCERRETDREETAENIQNKCVFKRKRIVSAPQTMPPPLPFPLPLLLLLSPRNRNEWKRAE